jgi:CheY-like chemotaxis protein
MEAKHVLIVDDDPRNIFALAATLRARKFDCSSFQSAAEALDFLKTDAPVDAVLIDMMMPDIDGYEAIPMIREIRGRENLQIVAVTAQAMSGDREKSLAAGADYYVSKPVDVDKLLGILQNC